MDKQKMVDEILNRGVIKQVLPSIKDFRKALLSDKKMKFYIGNDATGSSLHLSHAKNFILLEEFRNLGHEVYVLFGDLTACVGDPSDKDSARAKLTREKAKENAESWIEQISCLINFECKDNPAKVVYNSAWHDKLSLTELLELLSNATVQQMIERDMFQKRLAENKPIFLHEFLYPMFQGYNSVALDTDVELCGTDQIFNALVGRDLLKKYKNKEKFVVAVNLMENPKTGALMSKSKNTGVFLGGDARSIFGQVMAEPDEMIEVILRNITRIPLEEIDALNIEEKPMKAKLFTAKKITEIFYGDEKAQKEYDYFVNTFSKRTFSADAEMIEIDKQQVSLFDLITASVPDESKSNIRRLIVQGAVSVDGEKCLDGKAVFEIGEGIRVKVGKRRFFEVKKPEKGRN